MFSQENVLGLIAPREVLTKRHPLRKSIHSGLCPPSYSTFGLKGTSKPGVQNVGGSTTPQPGSSHVFVKPAAMMGPPLGAVRASPTDPLIKHSKAKRIGTLHQLRQSAPDSLTTTRPKPKIKPDVPKMSDKPVFGIKSDMNYIKYNAIVNMLSRPPEVKPEENFLKKEGYGEVPKYLQEIKAQIQSEYDFIASLKNSGKNAKQPQSRMLPEEERLSLLQALKARWEQVNFQHQGMTFKSKIDTISEARKKEMLEEQLAQLEAHMEKLSCPQVWVAAS